MPWVNCSSCNGTGKKACHTCGGTGSLAGEELCTNCRGDGEEECWTCNGSGQEYDPSNINQSIDEYESDSDNY